MVDLVEPVQPSRESWKFVRELSQAVEWHFNWKRKVPALDEAYLGNGVTVENNFPAANGCLETAFKDLDNFFKASGLSAGGGYKIIIEKTDSACFEAYRLDIKQDSCRIQAGDTEGVRRGIYYLEDLLLGSDGPFLAIGKTERKPWLKSRISRCFFGPIKRPPLNRDELADDVDYYPDEYLNRLAHEGINGLWLTIVFSDLCKNSSGELSPGAGKRLAKLRRTVNKCLRYGIKTYIFCIEPRALAAADPLLLNNPVLKGPKSWNGNYCFCPFSDIAQNYLYETVNWIFTQVPGLGGMIDISYGERPTTCAGTDFGKDCPVCSSKTPGEIIAASLLPMEQGMHAAAPEAELISWLYVPENYSGDPENVTRQMLDIAGKLPEGVILQYNFESGGGKEQLGKYRHAGDYWLSYVGPSKKYETIMRKARKRGRSISAKIQVACSHEVATVPLVPAPGLLYRKYKAMHELGVSHVMQCWYFGNYPGVMNKAAGELAFEEFKSSEEDFLLRLARPEWGEHAAHAVKAWKQFAEAYCNYPLENMFQYYGPMHDGVVWPLYPEPVDLPLAPTWKLEYGTSGDRYGECLGRFSLEDVLTLCKELSLEWHKGVEILRGIREKLADSKEVRKDVSLVEALDVQFKSGYNILKFYALRDELLRADAGQGSNILDQMRNIVMAEINNSTAMLELCKSDSRLGFHSEAEGYKYFPAKLKWRIKLLKSLLEDDFPRIYERLATGKKALPEKPSKAYCCNSGKYEYTADFAWKADYADGKLRISIDDFANSKDSGFGIFLEEKPFYPPRIFNLKNRCEIEIPLITDEKEAGFNIFKTDKLNSDNGYNGWVTYYPKALRLALGYYDPQAKGRLILKKSEIKEKSSMREKLVMQIKG
ncbi:MAG: hypothetical protein WC082_02530 [Victivallales bacterium]